MKNNNLRDIARLYNRHIPDDVELVERNGYIFFVHPFKRYDPIVLAPLLVKVAIGAVIAGTAVSVAGTLQQGKNTEKIGEARAEIDRQNAEQARKAAVERAKIKKEKGRRAIETQKSQAAAGGIRLNVGVPLVIEAETNDIIAQDIGFILETGRAESTAFRSRAAISIAQGKAAKKKSKFDALSQGLMGAANIAFMGAKLGGFGGGTSPPPATPFSSSATGNELAALSLGGF